MQLCICLCLSLLFVFFFFDRTAFFFLSCLSLYHVSGKTRIHTYRHERRHRQEFEKRRKWRRRQNAMPRRDTSWVRSSIRYTRIREAYLATGGCQETSITQLMLFVCCATPTYECKWTSPRDTVGSSSSVAECIVILYSQDLPNSALLIRGPEPLSEIKETFLILCR